LTSFARKIIGLGSLAFDKNLFVAAIGIISESSKANGPTHHDGNIVHTILNIFQLIRICFPTGFDHTQNISSTTTFHITTTLSHFLASISLKNLPWFIERGRAVLKFSFQAKTLYCFFLSLYTADALQKNTSVHIVTY